MRIRGLTHPRKLVTAALALTGLLAASMSACAARSAAQGDRPITPAWTYGAQAATQLSQLPYLQPSLAAGGQSSFDRNDLDAWHAKADFGHFLATGRRGNVMLDQRGPGCVYRILMTSLQKFFPDDWVKIYFDGKSKPSIDMTVRQIFSGTNAPFLAPLVANDTQSSGGNVSYVPLCYHSAIEITTDFDRYYDISYESYPSNVNIKTWSPGDSTAQMQAEWANATVDPISTSGNTTLSGTVTLRPGAARSLASIAGADSIQSIKISIPGVTSAAGPAAAALLDNIWIRAYWDGAKTPNVNAPVGSFFALGQFGSYPAYGLVAGMDSNDTLYMYLPMPFQRKAVIQLADLGRQSIPGVGFQIQYRPFQPATGNFRDVGYFTTSYLTTTSAPAGRDIPILMASGSGKLVGVTASYTGDHGRLYLEGDERIYVDGSLSPAFYGSGTEDFFNGGFDFYHGPYSQPLSGNTAHVVTASGDETAAYRFLLADSINFAHGIVVSIQHGPRDNIKKTSAAMLAYYYQRRAPRSELTDALNVAGLASERRHRYVIEGQEWSGTHTYEFEGTAEKTPITAAGRGFRGYSQFTMAIAAANQGVDLRRMYDQGIASQQALVYVDGRLVGTWFVAGQNVYHRWAQADYLIPSAFTRGRRSIVVRIRYVSGRPYFTEYRYWAYSLIP